MLTAFTPLGTVKTPFERKVWLLLGVMDQENAADEPAYEPVPFTVKAYVPGKVAVEVPVIAYVAPDGTDVIAGPCITPVYGNADAEIENATTTGVPIQLTMIVPAPPAPAGEYILPPPPEPVLGTPLVAVQVLSYP
jgi:hypothetical protein